MLFEWNTTKISDSFKIGQRAKLTLGECWLLHELFFPKGSVVFRTDILSDDDVIAKQSCLCYRQSEGFHRTGYSLPACGTPGVSPDGGSSADAAAVIWIFRSTFQPGNYIWSLSGRECLLVEALEILRQSFCTEFRYELYGQKCLAHGSSVFSDSQVFKIS